MPGPLRPTQRAARPEYEASTRACAHEHGKPGTPPTGNWEDTRDGSTYLDAGAAGATASGNPSMEAVGAIHGAQKS